MREYKKFLHQKNTAWWKEHFKQQDKKIACKNIFVRGVWFFVKYPLKFSIIWIFLYWEYFRSLFLNLTFDAYFMDYQIQTTGKTVSEALTFLNKKTISLKDYVYRDVISKRKRRKAEEALDLLFTKYNAEKEKLISSGENEQTQWIETLWQTLLEKKCVKENDKSDFKLIMTNNIPVKKVMWCEGIKWLVQFVREGIKIGKIKVQGNAGEKEFIIDYIMQNFFPSSEIPHQKAKHYIRGRIDSAGNNNFNDKIKKNMYFVFEQTTTFAAKY